MDGILSSTSFSKGKFMRSAGNSSFNTVEDVEAVAAAAAVLAALELVAAPLLLEGELPSSLSRSDFTKDLTVPSACDLCTVEGYINPMRPPYTDVYRNDTNKSSNEGFRRTSAASSSPRPGQEA
jgi:hypothetical protein